MSCDCLRSAFVCLEAVEAQNRSATLRFGAWLEGYLAIRTTFGTGCWEHLARLHALILSLVATVLATLRSGKAALCIESLFSLGEVEWCTAVAAR